MALRMVRCGYGVGPEGAINGTAETRSDLRFRNENLPREESTWTRPARTVAMGHDTAKKSLVRPGAHALQELLVQTRTPHRNKTPDTTTATNLGGQ